MYFSAEKSGSGRGGAGFGSATAVPGAGEVLFQNDAVFMRCAVGYWLFDLLVLLAIATSRGASANGCSINSEAGTELSQALHR